MALVREAAVRSQYARGQPLSALVERFADLAPARTVLRWLAEARARLAPALIPVSEAILSLFPGIDPTSLLPAPHTAASSVNDLWRLLNSTGA